MKRISALIISFLVLVPFFASAHGSKYLEFNPDKSSSLKDADVATPSQVFFAQSDFLGGFDLWLANPGSAGTATFSFINDLGIVLSTKTVTIPTIALTSSGTKFHVDLNSQLSVLAYEKYSIKITTSMPDLRLYYSDRVQIISHNAPFTSPYITGVAMLGSEEQYFSFKYALYENNETSAPIISNISWSVVSSDQMKVSFNANEAVDYRIEYGPSGQGYIQSTNFLGDYEFCTEGISICDIIISVFPDTTYQYRLTVKDTWGNQSQTTGTFVSGQAQIPSSTPMPAGEPAVISNLRVAGVTNNSVDVAWTTNEIANSQIIIKFGGFITITSKFDVASELEHFLATDPVLNPGTAYTALISSRDTDNNETTASLSFTTMSGPTPTPTPSLPPTPTFSPPLPTSSTIPSATPQSSLQPSPAPSPSNIVVSENGNVKWNSPASGEPSDGYRIDVFDRDGKLVKTIFAPSGSNQAEIPGLADGEYNIIVYTNDEGVFKKIDVPAKLKVEEVSLVKRLLAFWPFLIIVVALGGVLGWLKLRKKTPQITTKVIP